MTARPAVPDWLRAFPVERVVRIDLGLEGDWSGTVRTIWSPGDEGPRFGEMPPPHRSHRPAVELYLEDGWIGIHCFVEREGRYRLDRPKAESLVDYVARGGR